MLRKDKGVLFYWMCENFPFFNAAIRILSCQSKNKNAGYTVASAPITGGGPKSLHKTFWPLNLCAWTLHARLCRQPLCPGFGCAEFSCSSNQCCHFTPAYSQQSMPHINTCGYKKSSVVNKNIHSNMLDAQLFTGIAHRHTGSDWF